MVTIAFICVGILLLYVVVRGRRARRDGYLGRFVLRLSWVGLAAGLAETTCIRWYGFYAYEPDWVLFFDQVPVLVMVIWPFVIHSAWDLSRYLLGRDHNGVPFLGAAIVLADASLIEPIAVQAGLWHWHEPGLFSVPPIALLGWAFFALACLGLWQQAERRSWPGWVDAATVGVAPVLAHSALLVLWWGMLRWLNHPVPSWVAVASIWPASLAVTVWCFYRRVAKRIPLQVLLLRVPPTLFFAGLLAIHGRQELALVSYVAAFAPPYLVLTLARRSEPAAYRRPSCEG